MWASRWTARWTSPRSHPISSCWKTACWCWSRACWKAGGCSATLSNTSRWRPARTSATCSVSWEPARSCLSCPSANPSADQQPPLRLLADHHPHRRGGCGLADQAAQVGDWEDPAFYSVYRADQFDLRLPDDLSDAVYFQLLAQPGPVS